MIPRYAVRLANAFSISCKLHAPMLSVACFFASLVFNHFSTVSGNLLLNKNQNVLIKISAKVSKRGSMRKGSSEVLTEPYRVSGRIRQHKSTVPAVRMKTV